MGVRTTERRLTLPPVPRRGRSDGPPYVAPPQDAVRILGLREVLPGFRGITDAQRERLMADATPQARLTGVELDRRTGPALWCAGDLELLAKTCVAVVGTRDVSDKGAQRARRLGKELAQAGIVVISGLARGVDTHALQAAMEAGGRVVAVIGTPIDRAYPAENIRLQERIYREHLLVSQFAPGTQVYKTNFPARNKVMAAISDATVIVEASDTSGALHQARECQRLGRWLFICRNVAENPELAWPPSFLKDAKTRVLTETSEILRAVAG